MSAFHLDPLAPVEGVEWFPAEASPGLIVGRTVAYVADLAERVLAKRLFSLSFHLA